MSHISSPEAVHSGSYPTVRKREERKETKSTAKTKKAFEKLAGPSAGTARSSSSATAKKTPKETDFFTDSEFVLVEEEPLFESSSSEDGFVLVKRKTLADLPKLYNTEMPKILKKKDTILSNIQLYFESYSERDLTYQQMMDLNEKFLKPIGFSDIDKRLPFSQFRSGYQGYGQLLILSELTDLKEKMISASPSGYICYLNGTCPDSTKRVYSALDKEIKLAKEALFSTIQITLSPEITLPEFFKEAIFYFLDVKKGQEIMKQIVTQKSSFGFNVTKNTDIYSFAADPSKNEILFNYNLLLEHKDSLSSDYIKNFLISGVFFELINLYHSPEFNRNESTLNNALHSLQKDKRLKRKSDKELQQAVDELVEIHVKKSLFTEYETGRIQEHIYSEGIGKHHWKISPHRPEHLRASLYSNEEMYSHLSNIWHYNSAKQTLLDLIKHRFPSLEPTPLGIKESISSSVSTLAYDFFKKLG